MMEKLARLQERREGVVIPVEALVALARGETVRLEVDQSYSGPPSNWQEGAVVTHIGLEYTGSQPFGSVIVWFTGPNCYMMGGGLDLCPLHVRSVIVGQEAEEVKDGEEEAEDGVVL